MSQHTEARQARINDLKRRVEFSRTEIQLFEREIRELEAEEENEHGLD